MKHDVIVLGSGLGGLECAYILAREGLNVLVLEKGAQAGGCMQSYRRRGLDYDTGLHYIGGLDAGQTLHPFFSYLGLLSLPWHKLDPLFDHLLLSDREFAFATGYDHFVEHLCRDFPTERPALEAYARLLQSEEHRQLRLFSPALGASPFPTELFDRSAYDYLQQTFASPLLRNVLSAAATKMELRRDTLPLFSFLHANSSFIESSWRLAGGGHLLVESLVSSIHSFGGRVVCGARVDRLDAMEGKIVAAHCANGETYEASTFIGDLHPASLISLVQPAESIKPMFRRRLSTCANTYGMFTVSLRLKPETVPYFNFNQYIYAQPDVWSFYEHPQPQNGVMVSCRVPQDGSTMARQIDLLSPMTWTDCLAWADTRHGHRGTEYEDMKAARAEVCIALAEQFIPHLSEKVEAIYTSTPLTYRDYLLAPQGTAYGMRKDCHAPLLTFLSPRSPLQNLLFTGQSVMLHGVQGVTLTAFSTCAALLGKDKIWQIITQNRNFAV